MEIRSGNVILNVDMPLNEYQQKYIFVTAHFVELMLMEDPLFMDLSMIHMTGVAQMIGEKLKNTEQ